MSEVPVPVSTTHVPVTDDRSPKVRKKLMFWDRAKVLVIIFLLMFFIIAKKRADVPIESLGTVIREQMRAKAWLLIVAGLETIRQFHYSIEEISERYYGFWKNRVWGGWDRRMSRLNPWLRYRMGRFVKVVFLGSLVVLFLANRWGMLPIQALVEAPARVWNAAFSTAGSLPFIIQIAFTLMFAVGQFVAIFWFMSRGGSDLLMPDEVQTRFSDIWGQDKVVERVRENIDFLERPAEIEAKGGHVPSGILLWGPPGTGKTMIAQAVAGETGRPYMFVDPGAFQAMFMGVGIMKVRALFKKLRKMALRHGGVIAFFDEADSLGNRGAVTGGFGGNAREAWDAPHMCNGLHYVTDGTSSRMQAAIRADLAAAAPAPAADHRSIRQIVMGGMGGGGMGTLQALLTEISGLEKPRGWLWKRLRKFLGMPAKKPPKYRILIMMATNLPEALDDALLRPGRIDRIYRVGFPNLEGRVKTYEGYLNKVQNEITPEQIERIALMSPNASGAKIKDTVNEALIVAMRAGRDSVTWQDLLKARELKTHGMSDDAHPVSLERHNVAIHEASHAIAMKRLKLRETIDIATIERRGPVGGFVAPVPLEEEGFPWKKLNENEIITFLASLAGERHFYGGENSVGVGGDLGQSTRMVTAMLGQWGMGDSLVSRGVLGGGMGGGMGGGLGGAHFAHQVDDYLKDLLARAFDLVVTNERWIMAIAHALEQYHTISGEDIDAILDGVPGPVVDGRWYHTDEFLDSYRRFHAAAVEAHQTQGRLETPLPVPNLVGAYSSTPLPPPPPPALVD